MLKPLEIQILNCADFGCAAFRSPLYKIPNYKKMWRPQMWLPLTTSDKTRLVSNRKAGLTLLTRLQDNTSKARLHGSTS